MVRALETAQLRGPERRAQHAAGPRVHFLFVESLAQFLPFLAAARVRPRNDIRQGNAVRIAADEAEPGTRNAVRVDDMPTSSARTNSEFIARKSEQQSARTNEQIVTPKEPRFFGDKRSAFSNDARPSNSARLVPDREIPPARRFEIINHQPHSHYEIRFEHS
ncbi:MAG TPA: hypothetical protein VEO95_12415 [Chthoniobacteraceae bacterium]|nr:hypothetical protein [Chthoniobacteraceae bacterium]